MSNVTLNSKQAARATKLKQELNSGRVSQPQDINRVRPWTKITFSQMQSQTSEDLTQSGNSEKVTEFVDPDNIIGVDGDTEHRLENSRLIKVLSWMLDGNFDNRSSDRPQYIKFQGDYYVSTDGVHRSMACKAVGVEAIQADVRVF
jgi:hypothetical protein